MPETVLTYPVENNYINNYYFTMISMNGLSPDFYMYTFEYTANVSGDSAVILSVPENAEYIGSSNYSLKKGTNEVYLTVKAQTGYTRTYTVTVTASKACTLYVYDSMVKGDINCDGYVDSLDAVALRRYLNGSVTLSGLQLDAADFNSDGSINSSDVKELLNYAAGL